MKRLLALLLLLPLTATASYTPPLEYGVATTITFDLYNTDGTLDVDEVDGGAEVTLYCDEAAGATATNDFVDEGPYYSLALTATEMQCARLVVSVGATDTNNIHVWTIGSASAQVDDDGGWLDAVPWNAAWDAEVESEVDDSIGGGTGTALTAIPYNSAWDADIQSEAADALTAYDAVVPADLPTNFGDLSITATTGRVDVAAIAGTAQTANDNGADINAILVDTNELQTDDVPGLIAALNDVSTAQVNAEVDTALADIHLDHLLATNYDPASKPGVATALLNELVEDDAGVSRYTVNALEQGPSGSGASAASIADAVWDEARSGHTTTGSFGEYVLADVQVWDGTAVSTALVTLADMNAEVDTALADIHLDHAFAVDYDPASKPGTATALFNELVENDAGVSRYTVNALEQGPSGSGASAASIADAVWDEAQADHVTAGSFGVTASEIASILADTGEIGSAGAGLTAVPYNSAWDAEIQSEAADALTAYDPATGTEVAALNDLSQADVRTAVGLASANLDTQLAALPTAAEIETELLEAVIDGTIDLQCALAIAVSYGSGDWDLAGSTVTYRNPGDTADRIVGTTSASTFDATTITCP